MTWSTRRASSSSAQCLSSRPEQSSSFGALQWPSCWVELSRQSSTDPKPRITATGSRLLVSTKSYFVPISCSCLTASLTGPVRIVVRDSALREKDPVLGVIEIHLNDIFQTASEVTRKYPVCLIASLSPLRTLNPESFTKLEKGIGYGKAKISLLFQPVKLQLPPNMQGWDTGTVELSSFLSCFVPSDIPETPSPCRSLQPRPSRSAFPPHTPRSHPT
jgi:hypothetical protein